MDSSNFSGSRLTEFRPYLTILARAQIPQSMQARLDASDIVQETLMEAHLKIDQFRGGSNAQAFAAWLRQLLTCNLLDAMRGQYRQARDVRREQLMQAAIEQSASGFDLLIAAEQSTPSQVFDRQLHYARLAEEIEKLPNSQRDAILMRYFQQLSLEEIADRMQKSKPAVAGLLQRGLDALRRRMVEAEP